MGAGNNIHLWKFDDNKLASAASHTKLTYKRILKDGEALAYFCNETGSGTFTPMVSAAAAQFLREVIYGIRKVPGYSGMPAYSKRYEKRKDSGRGWHFRTGRFVEHISFASRSVGNVAIGYVTMDKGTTKGGAAYSALAKWLEHGTRRGGKARPVMHLAMQAFVAQKLPPMLAAVKKSIMKSIAQNHKELFGGCEIGVGELTTLNVASHFKYVNPMNRTVKGNASAARQILASIGMGNTKSGSTS